MSRPPGNAAERAGRAAKTASRRRKKRERVVGVTAAALVLVPLLFAAVWVRMEISGSLRHRDDLLAERRKLDRSLLDLAGRKARLSTWESVAPRARGIGLRAPEADEVVWVSVPDRKGKTG